jgi:hypothetical protein
MKHYKFESPTGNTTSFNAEYLAHACQQWLDASRRGGVVVKVFQDDIEITEAAKKYLGERVHRQWNEKETAATSPFDAAGIEKYLDMSTGHMTRLDGEILQSMEDGKKDKTGDPLIWDPHSFGWWVYTKMEDDLDFNKRMLEFGYSGALVKILNQASAEGFTWIKFDADGFVHPNVPQHGW